MFKIVEKKILNDSVTSMKIEAPFVARKAEAGQFIILRVNDDSERIPLTIAGYDRNEGTIRIIFQIVGSSTALLGAKEEGEYTIDDITDNVAQKMIDRHPHIFSDTVVKNSDEVLDNWEEIKRKERGQKKTWESLSDITPSLPALMRCVKFISKAEKGGVLPENGKNAFLKDGIELNEDNLGECLFEICRLAKAKNLDPEAELGLFLKNFTKKVKKLEENT